MKAKHVCLLGFLGAYLNIVAFGFRYGIVNHQHQIYLPLVNWLRDRSLYPDDPVTQAFARIPSLFWRGVAYASEWTEPQNVLFVAFLVTKILFFLALARLMAGILKDYRLVTGIIAAIALSPLLNRRMPFGYSFLLDSVQTHTMLAVALALWVGCLLVERRWLAASVFLGLTAWINVLVTLYTLFPVAGFVLLDWRQQKRKILLASLLLVALLLPVPPWSHATLSVDYPASFLETLDMIYPFHYTLQHHSFRSLFSGLEILATAACMVLVGARFAVPRYHRLELLAGFSLVPVLFGALAGEFFQFPQILVLQLLRADMFLIFYSVVLVQFYAAAVLLSSQTRRPATALLVGVSGVLLPMGEGVLLALFLLISALLLLDSKERFETLCRRTASGWSATAAVLAVAGLGLTLPSLLGVTLFGLRLGAVRFAVLAALASAFFVHLAKPSVVGMRTVKLAAAIAALALLVAAVGSIPKVSRLWNPVIPPDRRAAAWLGVQQWAKNHTPRDTKFMVPPVPSGFRMFSERTGWVDYKDFSFIWFWPPYADEWRRRINALGIRLVIGEVNSLQAMNRQYQEQPLDRLITVARAHGVRYIVQYTSVSYPPAPVFANQEFAVYEVPK